MKKNLLLTFFLALFTVATFAQGRTVTGRVTSEEDGSGLPGVNVLIKGTTSGVATDADGNFAISVPGEGGVLVFSFIGLVTKEVAVGTQSVINVTMAEDAKQLSEVVIVGYGVQTKEALTGSVGIVEADKLQQINTSTFENALQGAVPGVQITSNDGAPGSNTQVRIRGIGSITAGNEPLYVVDGIPVISGALSQTDFSNGGKSSNVMAQINPNDIETITVLKDASATAIYGSRGANGVIIITTKSGKAGKPKVSLKNMIGFNQAALGNLLQPLNVDQYNELFVEGYKNRATPWTDTQIENQYNTWYPNPANTNWLDAIQRTGITQSYDLSASGGTDAATYFASVGYFNQQGHLIGNEFERFNTRLKVDFKIADKVKISNNLGVSKSGQVGITDGTRWQAPMYNALLLPPVIPIYDDQGRFYGDHANFMIGGNNPVGHLSGDDIRTLGTTRITDNVIISVDIMEGLTAKTAWSYDLISVDEFLFSNKRYGDGRNYNGYAEVGGNFASNWIGTQTLNYNKTLAERHGLSALVGYEAQKQNTRTIYGYGENYPSEQLRTLASAASNYNASSTITENTFVSMFSRFDYDYDGKYFASLSLRRDGSSRFGANNRFGNFWSVGGSYLISEEGFMSGIDAISLLKLRASYGITGNAAIGNFPSLGLYGFGVNYDGQPGSIPTQLPNPNLTWESQENFNVGLDFGLFGNKLTGTVEYFNRLSSDLILDRPLSLTTGFGDITENVGDMRNKGWEVTLSGTPIETPDFSWNISGNISFLTNEITYLPEPIIDGTKRREEGRDFQEYWMRGWAGVDPQTGDPLWYKDETMTETTNDINQAVQYYQGKSATPDFFGGVNNTLTYKNFTLDFQFNFQFGHYIFDDAAFVYHGDGRFTPRNTTQFAFENRWKQPGDEALFPKFIWGGNRNSNSTSSRYLMDGSYIRLRNVQLSYNLPTSIAESVALSSIRAYVRLNNYWTWTKDKNLYVDPEQQVNGIASSVTPQIKTISLGIDIGL